MLGIANHFIESSGLRPMSLTQLYDRFNSMELNIGSDERFPAFGQGNVCPKNHPITVAPDATGISLNKYGGWSAHKWNRKKVSGWVKLHAAVDVETNEIPAFVVTDEKVGDITCTEKLMDIVMAAGHDVGTLSADAGYDSKENRNHYSKMGIRVCMNINSTKISEKHAVKYP